MFGWKHRQNDHGRHGHHHKQNCTCRFENGREPKSLADVEPGEQARICCLHGENRLIRRLSELGFTPGTEITVVRRAPFFDPIEFELRGYLVSLRREEAYCVRVQTDIKVTSTFHEPA